MLATVRIVASFFLAMLNTTNSTMTGNLADRTLCDVILTFSDHSKFNQEFLELHLNLNSKQECLADVLNYIVLVRGLDVALELKKVSLCIYSSQPPDKRGWYMQCQGKLFVEKAKLT